MSEEAARQKAEEGRVEAEVERVEHEVERRVAEGGEQAVVEQGRVEAEIERESTSATRVAAERGRVEAEVGREVAEAVRALADVQRGTLRSFYLKLGTFVALPLAFVALLPALIGLYLIGQYAEDNRQQVVESCQDIEALKTGVREEAIQDFSRLDETLALLGIARTPEVVAVATRNRDEKLKRYAARDCQVP